MKNYYCFILLFILPLSIKAQKALEDGSIVTLHPAVGPTITLDEKKKFHLLPQEDNLSFESAQLVKYNDSTYSFLIRKTNDDRSEKFISKAEVEKMYAQIEQINPTSTIPKPVVKKEPKKTDDELESLSLEKENDKWADTYNNPPPGKSVHHSKNNDASLLFGLITAILQAAAGFAK